MLGKSGNQPRSATDSADPALIPSRYLVVSDIISANAREMRVIFSTRSGKVALIPDSVWQSLRDLRVEELPAQLVKFLTELAVLVPAAADERQEVIEENRREAAGSTELVQVIQPTARCQLDCHYCGQSHDRHSISISQQDALIQRVRGRMDLAVQQSRPYKQLTVSWFGGEPLLAMPAMRRLSLMLRDLAKSRRCEYSAQVVTNGLRLTADAAHELQDLHSVRSVEITLDGPQGIHDRRRPTKSGAGSYERILGNLIGWAFDQSVQYSLSIRCNVDSTNWDSVPALIAEIAALGLQRRATLYFAPIHNWGNDAHSAALQPVEFSQREIEWLKLMLDLGYQLDLLPRRRSVVCISQRREGRVIDAFGTEYNCTEVPYVLSYGVPNSYATGHVEYVEQSDAGRLFFQEWNDEIARGVQPCAGCVMLPACGGFCPKSWYDGISPCPSYRINLPERLLLNLIAGRRVDPAPVGR